MGDEALAEQVVPPENVDQGEGIARPVGTSNSRAQWDAEDKDIIACIRIYKENEHLVKECRNSKDQREGWLTIYGKCVEAKVCEGKNLVQLRNKIKEVKKWYKNIKDDQKKSGKGGDRKAHLALYKAYQRANLHCFLCISNFMQVSQRSAGLLTGPGRVPECQPSDHGW